MYSYVDTTELAPDLDALLRDDVAIDSFARDDEDFERDTCADSPDEYLIALFASVDDAPRERRTPRDTREGACASAHAGASNISAVARALAMRERVLSMRAELTRDAFDRALRRATHPPASYRPPAR